MTTEDIKRIVDDERVEQLTAQLCRHWEVATERLEGLAKELEDGMDTCAEAEIYAALMRMQSAVMALMELSKLPCTYLFTAYLERIAKTVSNEEIRGSVVKLIELLLSEKSAQPQTSFFDMVNQSLKQHFAFRLVAKAAGRHPAESDAHAAHLRHLCPTSEANRSHDVRLYHSGTEHRGQCHGS